MTVFIDQLRVRQEHPHCPEWGSIRRYDFDIDTGELVYDAVHGMQVEGSYATSVRVRSDGRSVEVSGNPSKFGRLDNLVGIATMGECLELYNRLLRQLGLPEFELRSLVTTIGDQGGERFRDGPVISTVHVTRNLICGQGGDRLFLDWMESHYMGRLPFKRERDSTVQAGSQNRRQRQLYLKGPEIRSHALKWRRSRSPKKLEDRDEAVEYLERLLKWCEEKGVVRDEVKLGRKWLQESEYRYPENWSEETAPMLHVENSEVDTMNAGALSDYGVEVRQRLLAVGCSSRLAGSMANAVSGWLAGQVWDLGLGRPTRYRYLKALREHCGLDLRKPCNVRALATCVKPKVLEVREMQVEDLPDWYRWPEQRKAA